MILCLTLSVLSGPLFATGLAQLNPGNKAHQTVSLSHPSVRVSSDSFSFANRYNLQTLDLPLATGTIAEGVNDHGVVTGVAFDVSESGWILKNGGFQTYNFGEPGSTEINSINDRSVAIGDYFGTDGKIHGFVLSKAGKRARLDFPQATLTIPAGISNRPHITGIYTKDPSFGGLHGFDWFNGVFTTIDFPSAGVTDTLVFGNNNAGELVGAYFDSTGGHGFERSGGQFMTLEFPGSVYTQPVGINDSGDIVGHYQTTPALPSSAPEHGFVLVDGKFHTFDFPGATATRLFGINDLGTIVGWYIDSSDVSHGFVAVPR